jgi:hypothetical protein
MKLSILLALTFFLAGCAEPPPSSMMGGTSGMLAANCAPSADDEALSRVREVQSHQAKSWGQFLERGKDFGWSAEDMAALTLLQQIANEGSEVYSVDQLEKFTAAKCAPSALSAAERIERLVVAMQQVFENAPLPQGLTEEQSKAAQEARSKDVQETRSHVDAEAAYLASQRPCERMQAERQNAVGLDRLQRQQQNFQLEQQLSQLPGVF